MLGGYSSLNVPDIDQSHEFLDDVLDQSPDTHTTAYALDCGAGIGRITKQLLLPRFHLVDMVDVTQAFLDQAEEFIGPELFPGVGERFCSGLEVSVFASTSASLVLLYTGTEVLVCRGYIPLSVFENG